jgi:hypothetical protein
MGLISLQVYADDYDFTPGLWESTVTMEFKGIPEQMAAMLKMPMKTELKCAAKEDFAVKPDDKCRYEKTRVSKNKMKINITCNTEEGVTKGTGEINFKSKSSSGWIEMSVNNGPMGPMTMKSTFNSKYMGACK